MKWQHRGHEFDEMYDQIKSKHRFHLFGAGDYGRLFLENFSDELQLIGYIDNNIQKQADGFMGKACVSIDTLKLGADEAIIVTMSQLARVKPLEQLKECGFRKNIDYFLIDEFISVYNVYKYGKVYFPAISFLPSTICNLKCKNCLNFNPFTTKFYSREWDVLVQDLDLFFSCVDHIMLFHVSGGEPMLYEHTADLIEYIDHNYGDRIDKLRTVTNGTIVPKDSVLEKLSKCRVEVVVDDYRDAVPQYKQEFEKLLQKLEQYQIRYYVNKVDAWINLAPDETDYSDLTEKELIQHRVDCTQSWQELRDGKLYNCNYAAYATVAGIAGDQDMEETYDLNTYIPEHKKELIEFRLGFSEKGYTNFCKKCRGFTQDNTEEMIPAVQAHAETER